MALCNSASCVTIIILSIIVAMYMQSFWMSITTFSTGFIIILHQVRWTGYALPISNNYFCKTLVMFS